MRSLPSDGCEPGQRDRVSVLANCQRSTEVGGNGGLDVDRKAISDASSASSRALLSRLMLLLNGWRWVTRTVVSSTVMLRKSGPRPLSNSAWIGPQTPDREERSCTDENCRLRRI